MTTWCISTIRREKEMQIWLGEIQVKSHNRFRKNLLFSPSVALKLQSNNRNSQPYTPQTIAWPLQQSKVLGNVLGFFLCHPEKSSFFWATYVSPQTVFIAVPELDNPQCNIQDMYYIETFTWNFNILFGFSPPNDSCQWYPFSFLLVCYDNCS